MMQHQLKARSGRPRQEWRRHLSAVLLALPLALLLPAGAVAQQAGQQEVPPLRTSAPEGAPSRVFRLFPGDVVELRVFREPEASGHYLVDERGTVVLPFVGRVNVTDEPMDDVRERLLSDLSRFLRNPSVDVVFLRRISVLGAVRNPGLYRVDPTMTVAEVMALAGGATPDGHTHRLDVVRDGVRIETSITRGSRLAELGLRSGDQLFVPERHWLSRNPAVGVSLLTGFVSILVALLLR
jgi:protein involved in polysaccharide export with SLBB domain